MQTNKRLKLVVTLPLLLISLFNQAQDKIVPYNEVPVSIKTYITTHFSNHTVLQASVDKSLVSKEYDILLSDGIKLEFNRKNKIKEIDSKTKLPESVIPEKIRQYMAKNYSNHYVTDWEIDGKHQQVGLDNGMDLEFTMKGDFIRIDQ